jgi:predicted dienelactone hydrolase
MASILYLLVAYLALGSGSGREGPRMPSILRVFLLASLVTGLIACGDDNEGSGEPVEPPDSLGAFAVGHTSFTAVDPARNDRPLPVDVWYPVDREDAQDAPLARYPLAAGISLSSKVAVEGLPVSGRKSQTFLVFSHGYGGTNTQSVDLMETLASHGFIVASPEHTGNAQSSMTDSFDEAAANRVPDVSFLIDTMFARNRDPEDDFYNRLDERSVGVLGHSFGGMTAIGVAAGWAGAQADPRVAAIVPISAVINAELQSEPRNSPNAGFDAEQLASIRVPVMLIGGTKDTNVPIENNAIAFEEMTSAPRVYKVDIIGATHTHFANICSIANLLISLGIGPQAWPAIGAQALIEPYQETCSAEAFPIDEAIRLQNLYVVSFFKRHLLNQKGYDRYLTTDYAKREPAIRFSVR